MKKFLIVFIFTAVINYSQYNFWEIYNTMPNPVAGGDIWQNEGNVFIFGGYSDSTQNYTNWVQGYNLLSNNWKLDTMKVARFGLVVENFNNKVYFFGGINSNDSSINGISNWGSDFLGENSFSFNKNFNRIFSTGHIVGDNLYVIGGNPLPGTRTDSMAYIFEYNLNEAKITYSIDTLFKDNDFPEQQMSEVIGNDIFIFGGEVNGISQDIYKYNIVDHSYTKLDIKLLEPRAGGRAVIGDSPNQIIIIGGFNETSLALNSVEIFYATDNEYFIEQGAPIQQARYNFMTAKSDGYVYILGGFDENGNVVNSIERTYLGNVVNVEDNLVANKFELFQNYPNPFNPTTSIEYSIPGVSSKINFVRVIVFDILGREVKTLVNENQKPDIYKIQFEGSDLSSGVYYYQLQCDSYIQTKKMLLLK